MTQRGPRPIGQEQLEPDRREIENSPELTHKLIKELLHGKRRWPRLRADMLPRLTYFEDSGKTCSLCGLEIGPREKDPRWKDHDPRCRSCEMCESPMIRSAYARPGFLRFHSRCFLKTINWEDWTDLRNAK